jgi:hypothetical protein
MDKQKIGKIKIAIAFGFCCLACFGIGWVFGYTAGINRAIEMGMRFIDFELKPEAINLIKSYLMGT